MRPPTPLQWLADQERRLASEYQSRLAAGKTDASGRLLPDGLRSALAKGVRWVRSFSAAVEAGIEAGLDPSVATFDFNGDGQLTSSDLRSWAQSALDAASDYALDEGANAQNDLPESVMAADALSSAIQAVEAAEAEMLREVLAGSISVDDAHLAMLTGHTDRSPAADDRQSRATSGDLGVALRGSLSIASPLAAIGITRAGGLSLWGYAWRLLAGVWTRRGCALVAASVDAVVAAADRDADAWPDVCDARRLGDRWSPRTNAPSEAPRHGADLAAAIAAARRVVRVTSDPRWRGGLLWPGQLGEWQIRIWWDGVVRRIERGEIRPGDPVRDRLRGWELRTYIHPQSVPVAQVGQRAIGGVPMAAPPSVSATFGVRTDIMVPYGVMGQPGAQVPMAPAGGLTPTYPPPEVMPAAHPLK